MILCIQKCLSYFCWFYIFIVILQILFLALCQNPFNGFFSMMSQIEFTFSISTLDQRRYLLRCFCKRSFLLIQSKPLKKNLQHERGVFWTLLKQFYLLFKIGCLSLTQNQNMSINQSHVTSKNQQWCSIDFFFFETYSCCPKYNYLFNTTW